MSANLSPFDVLWPTLFIPGEFDSMDACDQARWRGVIGAAFDAGLSAQASEVEALRKRAETWELLYMRAINEANGLTNYVEDRPELSKIERKLVAIEAAARAALKERAPNVGIDRLAVGESESNDGLGPF